MNVHFIAIGGAAMHNLAIALKEKGHIVTGSDDEVFDPSKTRLEHHGLLPEAWGWFPGKINSGLDAIILGMHAREDNPELLEAQKQGIKIYSYPEFLYHQTENKKRLVIAGSHGKTTITSMVMYVLKKLGKKFDYMVGAQIQGFDTMVGLSEDSEIAVIEGDEYLSSPIDRRSKFLWYKPHAAVVTGISWDHANVFPTEDIYIEQFRKFINSIEDGGQLAWFAGDKKLAEIADVNPNINSESYNSKPFIIRDKQAILLTKNGEIPLSVFGEHNMQNIEAAHFLCQQVGVTDEEFYNSIGNFKGAARRLQLLAENNESSIYLDFAHAPSKVRATTSAMKERDPEQALIACLELHTFSSLNKDFLPQYAGTLEKADEAYVYFNPEVVKHKKLPTLDPDFVKQSFFTSVSVFTDSDRLMETIEKRMRKGDNLLIMTSGNFNGQNLQSFAKRMIEKQSV